MQTARFLLKALAGGRPPAGSAAYLGRAREEASGHSMVATPQDWRAAEHTLPALRHAAARLALVAADALRRAGGGELVFEGEPWNETTVDLIRVARAHCSLAMHQTFVAAVEDAATKGGLSAPAASVLRRVAELHGVVLLEEVVADLLESGYLSGHQAAWLRAQKRSLTRALRPDAVALVDGFGYEDYLLNSALGRKDGDVYAALLSAARTSPLNATECGPAWKPVLEPLLSPQARSRL